ncbi:MAG: D-alanyl-D-alanine carboxypeptidase [Pseudomonadota bacterium]
MTASQEAMPTARQTALSWWPATLLFVAFLALLPLSVQAKQLFAKQSFTEQDAVSVRDSAGAVLYEWQADKALVPASLTKLVTADLAIDKWGIDHHFSTEFYLLGNQLWVRGLADPYLVSEELDVIAQRLQAKMPATVDSIMIDTSYMAKEVVPGRTRVADPYNAPLSAVAANFNTVMLKRVNGALATAEPQTPLTDTARRLAHQSGVKIGAQATRINLVDADNAQQHFAQLLGLKLREQGFPRVISNFAINQQLPAQAKRMLRHENSKTLADVLRGTLEYSNNFIANQLFLLLAESSGDARLSFSQAQNYAKQALAQSSYQSARLIEGSGLSRQNRINASDLHKVLEKLVAHRTLLKRYELTVTAAGGKEHLVAYAKTGTLDGVRTYAGFLERGEQLFQFVFMFNRATPYQYREQLLQTLANQLVLSSH